MKANASQIRTALDAPPADIRLYLLHGPDEAGANELAARLVRTMGSDAERIDLDAAQLKSDPARLADEAASLSLFGGKRSIRVTGAGEECLDAFTALLEAERAGNPVVAIAPSVRGSAKIVKLALGSPAAMAFACYVPEGEEADRIAIAIAREQGLRIDGDSARRIARAAGGDRAVMAREIEKLALYADAAPEAPRTLDPGALDAVGADLGESEIGPAVDAAVDGRADLLGPAFARLDQAGASPIPLLRALVRKLLLLADLRAQIDGGRAPNEVIERAGVFFKERPAVAKALRSWTPARLDEAIAAAREAERALMAAGTVGNPVAERALIVVARLAARGR